MKRVIIGLGIFIASAQAFAGGYMDSGYFNTNVPGNGYWGVPGVAVCENAITANLRMGSQNDEVVILQDYLHDQGYLLAAPNGYFGSATRQAVMYFQGDHRIAQTGTVGPMTRDALNEAICGNGNDYAYNDGTYGYGMYSGATISPTVDIPTTRVTDYDAYIPQSAPFQGPVIDTIPTYNPITPFIPSSPTPTFPTPSYPTPGTTSGIAYYPYDPFGRSPLPLPATLSITSPLKNTAYKEGDTMNISWSITNANVSSYVVTLDNTSTNSVRTIAILSGNQTSTSVALTKELLDAICAGTCGTTGVQQNFRLLVKATLTQNVGEVSTITARIDALTIIRPITYNGITLNVSKTPINSGETINLFLTTPGIAQAYPQINSLFWKIRSICQNGVNVTVNGQACGTESFIYQQTITQPPTITVTLVNNSWGPQQVGFEATAYTAYGGTALGTATASVVLNK